MTSPYCLILISLYAVAAERFILHPDENRHVQENCGKRNGIPLVEKILYGEEVTLEEMGREAPWVVSIHPPESSTCSTPLLCTGILISPYHVLTAAHCPVLYNFKCNNKTHIHDSDWQCDGVDGYEIRAFSNDGNGYRRAGKHYRVKEIIFPASYMDALNEKCERYNNDYEDIAIYALETTVEMGNYVCLAPVPMNLPTMTEYGYGRTGEQFDPEPLVLRKQSVKYIDCKTSPNEDPLANLPNGFDCIQNIAQFNGASACPGDSGGPVLAEHNYRKYTTGIMSTSINCSVQRIESQNGMIYPTWSSRMTSVPYYIHWICKYSGVCIQGADPARDRRPTTIRDKMGRTYSYME